MDKEKNVRLLSSYQVVSERWLQFCNYEPKSSEKARAWAEELRLVTEQLDDMVIDPWSIKDVR